MGIMVAATRTPEGEPNRCPVCGHRVRIEPSVMFADAPCPFCGHLLWFVRAGETPLLFEPNQAAAGRSLLEALSSVLGVPQEVLKRDPALLKQVEKDSIGLVQLIMELEGDG